MGMEQQIQAVGLCVQANVPVLLVGAPGVGKTHTVYAIARQLGWHAEVLLGSLRDRTDFGGFPVPDGTDRVRLVPLDWVRRLEARPSILFLDELTSAPPDVRPALLRVLLERVVGEVQLPEHVRIVAAANPPEIAEGGYALSAPAANRLVHLRFEPDLEYWRRGITAGWDRVQPPVPVLDPEAYREALEEARLLVAGYLERNPDAFLDLPDDPDRAAGPWPSPRTWDYAARLLAAWRAARPRPSRGVLYALLAGAVGHGHGHAFAEFVAHADLPDPKAVLADPQGAALPDREDQLFVLLAGAAAVLLREYTRAHWEGFWALVGRLAREGRVDAAMPAIQRVRDDLQRRREDREPVHPLPPLPEAAEASLVETVRFFREAV